MRPDDLARFATALRGHRRGSACRAVLDGVVVVVTLKRRGLRRLVQDRSDLRDADPLDAVEIAGAVDAGLGLLPVTPNCLRRSVTLLRELHRLDLGANLHIGVRSGVDGVEAHAWVQVADEVVNDDPKVISTYTHLSAGDAERLIPRFT